MKFSQDNYYWQDGRGSGLPISGENLLLANSVITRRAKRGCHNPHRNALIADIKLPMVGWLMKMPPRVGGRAMTQNPQT